LTKEEQQSILSQREKKGGANMEEIKEMFSVIDDPRHAGYIKHRLCEVLIMVMGAVICGITELADMMVYFENKLSFYTERFGIEKYPSKPTLSRILNLVDGDAVGKVVVEIMRKNAGNLGEIIAVDGKAICGSGKAGKAHSFLQILTVYATESGVTLGQEAIAYEDKTNEIPVFQSMLDSLDIKDKTVTADALHCQKETCQKIVSKGGNYVFGLKGNQCGLLSDVELYFTDPINTDEFSTFQTIEKNGGRIEKRVCRASDRILWLQDLPLWAGLTTIFAITRTTTTKGITTVETGYYITSLACDPKNLLEAARAHWRIESMHWMLDVIWNEDDTAILSENGLKTLNSFRKLALLGHKNYVSSLPKNKTIKANVLAALMNDNLCFDVFRCL
jgi:predicted transposase YbfD/YdcC